MAEIYLLGNTSFSQMFGLVIKTAKKTIVFDGGTVGDYYQLEDFLQNNCCGQVDAWFFTHPHHDHIGAFCEMNRNKTNVRVNRIFHSFPSFQDLKKYESRAEHELSVWQDVQNLFEKEYSNRVERIQRCDVFQFDDVVIRVLRVFNKDIKTNYVNNSSAVYRIETPQKSLLILGDLGIEGGKKELMELCPLSELQTDYTQMAHHGQAGVSKEFYEYIKPQKCIWATPEWLWNNDAGNGFDAGPWHTVRTRE